MKWVRNVLGIFMLAYASIVPIQTTSAQHFTVQGGSLTIQSKILKTHYIVIDEHSEITEISSNTTDKATPRVFFQKIAFGNERPLSEHVYEQYQAIVPNGKTTVGTIYKRSELVRLPLFSTSTNSNKADPLAFIKQ